MTFAHDYAETCRKIRNSGRYAYPSLRTAPTPSDPLDFLEEAESYKRRVLDKRSDALRALLSRLVSQIDATDGTRIFRVIPAHASEAIDLEVLAECVRNLGDESGHTLLFLNRTATASAPDISHLCDAIEKGLAARVAPELFSICCAEFAERQPIGTIRGLINDAAILYALDRKIADPILISNDVDHLAWPENYARILRRHYENPVLDVLSGPIYSGYSPRGVNFTDISLEAPELMLGNRVFGSRRAMMLEGRMSGGRLFTTEGPNSSFRASAVCAAGGYDYDLEINEDGELGMAVFAMRHHGSAPYPLRINSEYDFAFWLATDPRRVFNAIRLDNCIRMSWRHIPFRDDIGHQLDVSRIIAAYKADDRLMQDYDILPDGIKLRLTEKGRARVGHSFLRSLAEAEFEGEDLERYASFFGLSGVGSAEDVVRDRWTVAPGLEEALLNVHADVRRPTA